MAGDPSTTVIATIRRLLERRDFPDLNFDLGADVYDDLEMDSLEIAELSATLEDDLGRDPYSAGQSPRTVGAIIEYYA